MRPQLERQIGRHPFLIKALRDNPSARLGIRAARTMGISPRRFTGWEPTRTTEYIYGSTGKIHRTIERSEPEWSDTDQALIYADLQLEDDACPGCGGSLTETLTSKPPYEDDADYGVRFHKSWCRDCIALEKYHRRQDVLDETLHGTAGDEYPPSRRVSPEHIPPPDIDD